MIMNWLKAVYRLIVNMFFFIEILILTFLMIRTVESLAFGIVYFIALLILSRNWDSLVKPIAWGAWGLIDELLDTGNLLFAVILGLIFFSIRFALERGLKFMVGNR